MRLVTPLSLSLTGSLLLASLVSAAEIHTLRSGNGVPGGPDALVSYSFLSAETEHNIPLTPADFAAAQAGPQATILPSIISAWTLNLSTDPLAQWISDTGVEFSGSTCLYAIDFTVSAATVTSASLDFLFLCDNWVGEVWNPVNEGLYINGGVISGTSAGNYANETLWSGMDVTALVTPGPNTLYILSTDVGGPGGLNFSATVTINGDGTSGTNDRPVAFGLGDSFPNPFNPSTTIPFTLSTTGDAELSVYNMLGDRVAVLHSGLSERGTHEVTFDAAALPSGVYFARLSTEGRVDTRKLVLVK
jgi:hypothetical protein